MAWRHNTLTRAMTTGTSSPSAYALVPNAQDLRPRCGHTSSTAPARTKASCYLETSDRCNVAFYEGSGLRTVADVALLPGGPPTSPCDEKRPDMSDQSRRLAGVLLVLLPTVIAGGASILGMIDDPAYRDNELRQDLWRAGHAHAGVLLVLALVTLRYVDEATLGERAKSFARHSIPAAAILLPAAFFLSVTSADATEPNALIWLAYVGAVVLTGGLITLGVGLIRHPGEQRSAAP